MLAIALLAHVQILSDLTVGNVARFLTSQRSGTETRLAGWVGRTRTPESVRNKIHLNWRHNFRGLGRNGAPETFRVRAAALGICSSRKDFGEAIADTSTTASSARPKISMFGLQRPREAARPLQRRAFSHVPHVCHRGGTGSTSRVLHDKN